MPFLCSERGSWVWSPGCGGRTDPEPTQRGDTCPLPWGSLSPYRSLTNSEQRAGQDLSPDRSHGVWQCQEARACMAGAVQLCIVSGREALLSAAEIRGQLGPGLRPVNTVGQETALGPKEV